MALKLHPITEDQVARCVQIYRSAMGPTPADRAISPHGSTPTLLDFIVGRDTERLRNERNGFFLGVTDSETTELVAFAHWRLEDALEYQRKREKAERGEKGPGFPDSNPIAVDIFYPAMDRSHETAMGSRKHWHLALLCTRAGQERRGAGRLLVEWGTQRADQGHLETYLYGSEAGKPLYERCGFRAVGQDVMDFAPAGLHETIVQWPMIRKPEAE